MIIKFIHRTAAVSLLSAVACTSVLAQTNSEIEEVIVTATRTAQPLLATLPTAHVITGEDIRRAQPSNLAQYLGRISGLDFRDSGGRGSASGLFIRGTSSAQSLVLIDGVRTASATLGSTELQSIPVESIERIEIVKGPLSGVYGADAVGGVIQVFTKRGLGVDGKKVSGSIRHSIGSRGFSESVAQVSAGNQRYYVNAGISHEEEDGIDRTDIKARGNEDRDSFKETSGHLGAGFEFTDNLKLAANILHQDSTSEFDEPFSVDNGSQSDSTLTTVSVKVDYNPIKALALSAQLGYLKDDLESKSNFPSVIKTERKSIDLQADYKISKNHTVSIGDSYYVDEVETTNNFPEDERYNNGTFVQYQGQTGPVSVLANVRYDDNEAYGGHTSGSVAVSTSVGSGIDVTLSGGSAFIAPSFNQLYFPGFGNPDVKPQTSKSYELSVEQRLANSNWRASVYKTELEDLIAFDLAIFLANNIAEATIEGIELEYSATWGATQLAANLDYMEARDDTTNEYLTDRAVWTLNLESGWEIDQLYFAITYQAEHGRYDSGTKLKSFGVWGLNSVFTFNEALTLYLHLDNVFDKEYAVNFANSFAGSFYNSTGRTVKAGLEYNF